MQMGLAIRLSVSYALLNYIRGFFNELPVQVNRVPIHPAYCIVFPEDEV